MKSHSKSIFNIFTLFALVTSLLGSALTVTPAYAAGFVVTKAADTNDGTCDSDCSLREAITAANANGVGSDTITFAANYTITLVGSQLPAVTTVITINGNGAANTIVQANAVANTAAYRVFEVGGTGNLTLDSLTVRHGNFGFGGGIYNGGGTVMVTNSTLSGNSAIGGGGIYNGGGTVMVTNSTLSGNSAAGDSGGGIYISAGTVMVTNSTFSSNSASYGGGINISAGIVMVTNSTLSANSATQQGGGIYNSGTATLTVTNGTFSANSATFGGGGIYNGGTLNLANTIIANSTSGADCVLNGGTVATNTNNLIEDTGTSACGLTNGVNGNIIGSDPALGALADNGGPTQTHALLSSSSALGAGLNTVCDDNPGPNNLDQRGVIRPQGVNCDIGAYESNAQPGPSLVVNTNEDTDDGFCDAFLAGLTDCTLREAVNAANNISGTDTITFAANYTITLSDQLPAVTTVITITGNGAANTIVQANASANTATYRVFLVSNTGNLILDSLTVQHGRCNSSCATSVYTGGGIYNVGGTVMVTNSTLSGNSASAGGGGIYNNGGTVTVTNSTFSANSANLGGGIYNEAGTVTVTNSTLSANSAATSGGGISNDGTLTLTNSTLSGNSAATSGGGIYIFSGTLNLANTNIANSTTGGDCQLNAGTLGTNTNNLIEDTGVNACGLTNGVNGNIIGSDPALGSLTGSPAYFPLNGGSPAINAGDDTVCAAAPVNNTSQNGVSRPQGSHCDIGSFELPVTITLILKSVAANDGWVLESTETSGVGGTLNSSAVTFNLGDDAADKQYRAILHFNTSSLPDTAVITKVTLKIRKQGQVGTNPFNILGGLRVDMRKPSFGAAALAIGDFQVAAGRSTVSTFGVTPVSNWYSAVLNGSGRNYINKTGNTQFRLQFATDDNNDNGADYMKFFSGNAPAATRPQLIIEYTIP